MRALVLRSGLSNAILPILLAVMPACAATPSSTTVFPMAEAAWSAAPPVAWVGKEPPSLTFARYEGMPSGTMTVNDAVALSSNATFSDGTIEFDIKPLAYSDTGIIFRRHGTDAGEFVYVRANPDCPAADDCIQYAPIVHGRMDWDIYPNFEGQAPLSATGWNHLRLVVSGQSMLVYVNHEAEPVLTVDRLRGLTQDGGIALKGPAIYANLVIRSNGRDAPPALPVAAPDPGTITAWLAAPPEALPIDRPVPASRIPGPDAWRPVDAEATGLVNLGRAFGSPHAPSPSIGWLKTVVEAAAPARRAFRFGWARQITVFLNGEAVFSGDNPYYPAERRLSPNGRLEPDNATLPLLLRQGRNEIVLAVGDGWKTAQGVEKLSPYGWAAEAHVDDLRGIMLSR